MLLNQKGQQVHVDKKFNSKEQPWMFAQLVEVHEPKDKHCGKMFNLSERAKFKQ